MGTKVEELDWLCGGGGELLTLPMGLSFTELHSQDILIFPIPWGANLCVMG